VGRPPSAKEKILGKKAITGGVTRSRKTGGKRKKINKTEKTMGEWRRKMSDSDPPLNDLNSRPFHGEEGGLKICPEVWEKGKGKTGTAGNWGPERQALEPVHYNYPG